MRQKILVMVISYNEMVNRCWCWGTGVVIIMQAAKLVPNSCILIIYEKTANVMELQFRISRE